MGRDGTLAYLIIGVVLIYAGFRDIWNQGGQVALLIGAVFLLVGIRNIFK